MSKRAFSGEFYERMHYGKYAKWAKDISEDTLYSLFWAIGEWGNRCSLRTKGPGEPGYYDESFSPFPGIEERFDPLTGWKFMPPYMADRSRAGLEIIYRVFREVKGGGEFSHEQVLDIINSIHIDDEAHARWGKVIE